MTTTLPIRGLKSTATIMASLREARRLESLRYEPATVHDPNAL
jgi:hypothetical protein